MDVDAIQTLSLLEDNISSAVARSGDGALTSPNWFYASQVFQAKYTYSQPGAEDGALVFPGGWFSGWCTILQHANDVIPV